MPSNTTSNPGGVTNAAPWQTLAAAGLPDPTWAFSSLTDFDKYAAGDWTTTKVGTGTVAETAYDGGAILLTNTTGGSDSIHMQHPVGQHKLTLGKEHFFKFRGKVSDAVNTFVQCGLIGIDTTPLATADGLYFIKNEDVTTISLVSMIGSVATSVTLPASCVIASNVEFELGFYVDYKGDVFAFFNPTTGANTPATDGSVGVGYVAKLTQPGLTQVLLSNSFGLTNSSAAAHTLTVDYSGGISHR